MSLLALYKERASGIKNQSIPAHFLNEKKKEVVFNIKGGFPMLMEIPTSIQSFPAKYKGIVVRCEETFYRMRDKSRL